MRRRRAYLIHDGTFAALVRDYVASAKFAGFADNTRRLWGRELRDASQPDALGNEPLNRIRPKLVQAYLDRLVGRPSKASAARSALLQLERWAVVRDALPRQIMVGVEAKQPKGGHLPWSEDEVACAEAHMRPDLARAITLAVNSGQRNSDLIKMCWSDVENYQGVAGFNITQKKTGRQVWAPINQALGAAMAGWERSPGPILRNRFGRPWRRPEDLSMALANEIKRNAALAPLRERHLVLHGLRATACERLRKAGCNALQISSVVGMSVKMVERYTRFSAQKELALATVIQLGTAGERRFPITSKR